MDGNPPFDQQSRRRRALDWLSNVNFRDNWSTCRKGINASWNMFTNVFSFFDWSTTTPDPQAPHLDYGRIIGEEMTNILLSDPKFHFNLRLRLKQLYYYGVGAAHWRDEYDWRSEALLAANILVPYNAESCVDGLDFVIIRDELELGWLYDAISNEEQAEDAGWDVAEVRKLIVKMFKKGEIAEDGEMFMSSEWESIQHQIKTKTDESDLQFAKVRVNHFLVKEFDEEERVTHIIMPQNDDQIGFLFYGDRRFGNMMESCHVMFYDEGEGYYRSARGLAFELFATSGINDRLTNALIDGSVLSSGLIVQGVAAGDQEDMSTIVKQGPLIQLPAGLQLLQNRTFTPPLQPIVEVRRLLQGIQANNSGTSDPIDENFWRGMPEKSATQASIESTNEARFESSQAAWMYVQWEPWLNETARRMLRKDYPTWAKGYKEHKMLLDRCRARGVPDEWLNFDVWDRKKAERAIGLGNPMEARRLTQSLVAMSHQLNEQGAENAMDDWVGVRFGYHKVNRYRPTIDPLRKVTYEVSIVQLENIALATGNPLQPSPDQQQVVHITWHFRWLAQFLKPYMEQGPRIPNLEVLARGLAAALQHIGIHIQYLAQDPMRKAQAKEWMQPLNQFAQIYRQMQRDIQQIQQLREQATQQAQKQLQEASRIEDERERTEAIEKIRSKERVDMMNTISLDRNREMKTLSAIENMLQKTEAEINRQDRRVNAEINREDRKASAKTE